ncbi:MAG: LOW QUALITY PROTEIN: hypothetical protein BJ554DRAFT_8357 [Olpidium bornovanus]|uniref:Uncharacterized protein n=1 Tax=Olpidium bornovanus TaxID=278681 RepID=A0A8H7ZV31_9FUNG|nr:MAG: LOW QUALITY PROTEIN: hypothetical protein BJ554DRAFT_8357 [Olpidium bornovanus]
MFCATVSLLRISRNSCKQMRKRSWAVFHRQKVRYFLEARQQRDVHSRALPGRARRVAQVSRRARALPLLRFCLVRFFVEAGRTETYLFGLLCRRGKPQFLVRERYEGLRKLYIKHEIATTIARWMERTIDAGGWQTL